MRTFQEFMSKLDAVSESLEDRRDEIDSKRKEAIEKQKEKIEDREERTQLKKEIKNEIKQELSSEAYDAEVMGRSQIRKTGEGGRIGAERKKTTPERRRMKAVGGGKQEPVEYKDRSDIGSQRQTSTRVQQPTQERGSAALSPKEQQRKAYLERKAREGKGPATSKEKEKEASKLLTKKKEEKPTSPDYKPSKASGMTRSERMSQQRKGEAALKDIMKDQEFSRYEKETGQKATGKAKTKLLGRVSQRMAN
jgi:hypothetical protein